MNRRSLTFQLGALHALLLSAAFAAAGAVSYYGLKTYLTANLQDALQRRSEQVITLLRELPTAVSRSSIAHEMEIRLAPEFNSRFIRVTRGDSDVVYLSGRPADRSFDPLTVPAMHQMTPGWTRTHHLMVRATPVDTPTGSYIVEMGAATSRIDEVLARLLDLLLLLLPVLLVITAVGGYVLVNRALRPVDRISQAAEHTSLQNPALRLPVVQSGDALERLSVSLNNMLGRLAESVRSSSRFVADASHELRTPLTLIKGELEEVVGHDHWREDEVRDRIGSVLEEVARLEHLVSGLLAISRLDAGEPRRDWQEVDLAQLAGTTAEQMRLLAEERGVHIDPSALRSSIVQGDPARLRQVVVNLLDNAIRFTPSGGSVHLRTAVEKSGSVLEVADTGIGIPSAFLAHVFERFFRVDAARSRDDGGAGLGLSIVRSICALHGAQIEVHSTVGRGSSFRVCFPRRIMRAAQAVAVTRGYP